MEDRITNLENTTNMLKNNLEKVENKIDNFNNNINEVKNLVTNINKKFPIIKHFIELIKNNNSKNNEHSLINTYADSTGNLNNPNNPFIQTKNKIQKKENHDDDINEDSNDSEEEKNKNLNEEKISSNNNKDTENNTIIKKKRGQYKKRNPLYYFYIINDNEYKYTCVNKEKNDTFRFRCSDTKCNAKGVYYKNLDQFIQDENTQHIEYFSHSYIIKKSFRDKYLNNEFTAKDFLNNNKLDVQVVGDYFKEMFLEKIYLKPLEAKILFAKKFPTIDLKDKELDKIIKNKYRLTSHINQDKIRNTNNLFIIKDDNNNDISFTYTYFNEDDLEDGKKNEYKFVIIGNDNMLKNLKNNLINEYFMDCTYKCVPHSIYKFKLMVLSGFEYISRKTCICCFILLMNEKEFTFLNVFKILLKKYQFNPTNLMYDFRISQINAAKQIFSHCNLHCCFFHYSQAIWSNFKKYQLCGKGTYGENSELLFNLQLLCFIKKDKVEKLFDMIKNKYKNIKFNKFFNYFKRTWLGKTIPLPLWNYSDLIEEEGNSIINKKFHYTNNISENINKFLNINLRKAKCSCLLFKETILDIIKQFDNKNSNNNCENSKSEILKFYIARKNDIKLLSYEEIKMLNKNYDELEFTNVNKNYIENHKGLPNIVDFINDLDDDVIIVE